MRSWFNACVGRVAAERALQAAKQSHGCLLSEVVLKFVLEKCWEPWLAGG